MKLLLGDCTEVLPTIESGSVDTIATDPPYGISFLSMEWDTAASNAAFEMYEEEASKNPSFKKIYEPWKKFRNDQMLWNKVAEQTLMSFMLTNPVK